MKEKSRQIESENVTLADENDELRTFSQDGFKIAESITGLSDERAKLTMDLADQADQITMLLERKESLQRQLQEIMERR